MAPRSNPPERSKLRHGEPGPFGRGGGGLEPHEGADRLLGILVTDDARDLLGA